MRRLALFVLAALALDAAAQSSQENGLHIKSVGISQPGTTQVIATADAAIDKKIGATPNAKDFTIWLGGGAATDLTVARNGSRGKPLTTAVLLDLSPSYRNKFTEAYTASDKYADGAAATDKLILVGFSLNSKVYPTSTGPALFKTQLKQVDMGVATSVTVGLDKAYKAVFDEGAPGLREIIVFTDGMDEGKVTSAVWDASIAKAKDLGIRVNVIVPTEKSLGKFGSKDKYDEWVKTTTSLGRLATETGGKNLASRDPNEITKELTDARTEVKNALVIEGKLCGAKSGQPIDVRVEYVPGAKREAWTGGSQLPASAWSPGADAPCPSLCTKACSPWEECIAGTCAARTCKNDGACSGAVCQNGICGKACSSACASWQECRGGACVARACVANENCGAGSRCANGTCTAPPTKSNSLIYILAGAGGLLLLTALFVLFRKKPPPPVVDTPVVQDEPPPPEPEKKKEPTDGGVDLDPLPETHLVAIGGWTTPGERWRLHKRKTIAGASADAGDGVDLVFGGIKQVSTRHAQFDLYPSGDLWVSDLGSTNGTYVNGRKLAAKERAKLVPGDQVKLSQNLVLVVERPGAGAGDDPLAPPKQDDNKQAEKPAQNIKDRTRFDPGGR